MRIPVPVRLVLIGTAVYTAQEVVAPCLPAMAENACRLKEKTVSFLARGFERFRKASVQESEDAEASCIPPSNTSIKEIR